MSEPETAWALIRAVACSDDSGEPGRPALPPHAAVLRAYLLWRDGEYALALQDLEVAEPRLQASGDLLWQARACGVRGVIALNLGQSEQALELLRTQLELAQQAADPEMAGLAHNDIGVLLVWDDPQRAQLRFQMAYDLFRAAGPGYEAGLGLSAFNLSVASHELGENLYSGAMLNLAAQLVWEARAWPYWVGVVSAQALRLAEAGDLDAARRKLREGDQHQGQLPVESLRQLTFSEAKLETLWGDPQRALPLLDELHPWFQTRRDMLDDLLEVRAKAQAKAGQLAAAYESMAEALAVTRQRHRDEQAIQLKALEIAHRTQEAHRTADLLRLHAQALETLNEEVQRLSLTDDLTGIHNRRAFIGWARQQLDLGLPLALAFIDIDLFKNLNDRLGHQSGDEVLRQVARVLQAAAAPGDWLARLGGDEFVVARVAQTPQTLATTIEGVRRACETHDWTALGADVQVSISAGVTLLRGDLTPGLQSADHLMYTAKRQGRNRVHVLTPPDPPEANTSKGPEES